MKRSMFSIVIMFVFAHTINAQNDTIYFLKDGMIVNKQSIKSTDVDSVIFYKPTIAPSGTFTDARDGNVYNWVIIGSQVWMAENLKYLPDVVGPGTGSQTSPYYYVYGYNGTDVNEAKASANYSEYGVLYNWPAAMAASANRSSNPSRVQGVCPAGWHLPSDIDWTQLIDNVGSDGATKLKSTSGWNNNGNGTDEYGFTALPGGNRSFDGTFNYIGNNGYWWSATEYDDSNAWCRVMFFSSVYVFRNSYEKNMGFSVRCVKD